MADADWTSRQLCPDGACVGVIGDDGTCKVCGRVMPGWGDERQRGLHLPDADDDADDDAPPDADDHDAAVAGGSAPRAEGWDDRQLCPDGACVGVIGDGGRCTVCGKSATAQAS